MAGIERVSLDPIAPVLPKRDRPGLLGVPGCKGSLGAPHDEERTGDPTTSGTIRCFVFVVDTGSSPVFLTDGVCTQRISKSLHIGRTNLRGKHRRGRSPFRKRMIDNGVRNRRQNPFRKRLRLRKQ